MTATCVLHSLGGAESPADLPQAWQAVTALPERALSSLWDVLEPVLQEPDLATVSRRIEAFSKLHDIDLKQLDGGLQALRFILGAAAAHNLPAERLAEDLAKLSGDNPMVVEVLLTGFERIKPAVRDGLLRQTLLDHGQVLAGIQWRVDSIRSSQRGIDLNGDVALFTFRFAGPGAETAGDNEHSGRSSTFYLTPAVVAELRRVCDAAQKLLGRPAGDRAADG